MIVFISGMPRSGSTFSFNVVRLVLARRGTVQAVTSEHSDGLLPKGQVDHVINKAHGADARMIEMVKSGEARSICTIRRPEDAILSCMYVFGRGLNETIETFGRWVDMYKHIAPHSLIVTLDKIETDPVGSALEIGRYVCSDLTEAEAEEIAVALDKNKIKVATENLRQEHARDVGFSYYDAETFFHRRHVSDREKFDRNPELVDAIRKAVRSWTDERGDFCL